MEKIKYILIISTAIIIALLHFLVNPYKFYNYQYDLKLGEIAEKDIIAPFDFFVYKNQETLKAEQDAAAAKVQPIYRVSENLKFNAQKNLDFIFQHFTLSTIKDSTEIREKLLQNGYDLSMNSIQNLMNDKRRFRIYNFLAKELSDIFTIGIYPDNYRYQKIKLVKINRITEYELNRLYSLEEAKNKLIAKSSSDIDKQIIKEIADIILIENIVIDNEMTELEKQKAREKVPTTLGKVQKNEEIIGKNQKVTSTELLKLQSMLRAQKDQSTKKNNNQLILSSLGVFLFSIIILFALYYILSIFFPKNFSSTPRLVILLCSLITSILFTIIVNSLLQLPSLIIPYSFSVLLIAIIFSPHVGITFNFINLIFVSLFLSWSIINPIVMCLATLGGVIALKNMKKRLEYYPLTLYLILGFLLIITSFTLIRHESFMIFLWHLLWSTISVISSIMILVLLTPIVERKLNMATKQILLELLDFDNPVLKKMSMIIPGTYHHSLIVGNLAESAAEGIGANHLLARVGSYYHDIGKLENPQFFVENNPNSTELHDKMQANESANLIKNHIANGVALAKRSKLPKPVIEILQQHHGTSKIRYFYNKAIESNLEIDENQFHYEGPKPQTKEAAIVMIADIVESTTKSLSDFSEEAISDVMDKTLKNLINDGQLDEAPVTIRELDIIKKYMLPILMGVYRKRLEYPEEHKD
ncbi:MAG: HDIG domain-containing protein [Candidatus Cloacimonetes bacterium]|nr:HDIG domain-containing protein [Candidatus Cloacimonadota bacterium]MCF7813524.1 HDIG domain-containing protein [Candidatus Cloacimonadota bacterium]MCF7868692.1 HDIG domain-containing protein [Candidatus Cloacimonadota bacterium]MCF7884178.1 HDIG domain-containing protein [Candidatus Cloacimonadota bacterium]